MRSRAPRTGDSSDRHVRCSSATTASDGATSAGVHGYAVIGTRWPHDLPHDVRMATYDVVLSCEDCGRYPLDLSRVRAALRVPSRGIRKVDIKDVLRRVE